MTEKSLIHGPIKGATGVLSGVPAFRKFRVEMSVMPTTHPVAKRVIYGTVIDQDGEPAKEIGLTASPLGVPLGAVLPHTKTDQYGKFRFADIPWWGRYTVFADDEKAGYALSNGSNDPASTKEVMLSPEQPEAEFNLFLPSEGWLPQDPSDESEDGPIY